MAVLVLVPYELYHTVLSEYLNGRVISSTII